MKIRYILMILLCFVLFISWTKLVIKKMDDQYTRKATRERVMVVEKIVFKAEMWPAGVTVPQHLLEEEKTE